MSALGKTIRLYLMDGTAKGPKLAEVINWTGQVLFIPRGQLQELAGRPELRRTGIYALLGEQTGESSRPEVYVGEADDVFERFKSHDADEKMAFWTDAIAITSKDFNLTKAHARFLEGRMIELATEASRSLVRNAQKPGEKALPEPDRADMEYFLAQVELVLPALGFDFLRPPITRDAGRKAGEVPESTSLIMDEVGAYATAYELNGQFVVVRGSTARRKATDSWDTYRDLRGRLIEEGKLVEKDEQLLEFAEDVEFSSPSAAAAVVAAANRNGRLHWKLEETGEPYGEWKQRQIEMADQGAASA